MILMDNESKRRLLNTHLERVGHTREEKQQRNHDLFDHHGATLHSWHPRVKGLLNLLQTRDLGLRVIFPLMWLRKGRFDFLWILKISG
jgi:hypothetical protein